MQPTEHTASAAVQADLIQEQLGPQNESQYSTMDQYNLLATVGKGIFAKVMLAESKADHHLYAIKMVKKQSLIENDEVKGAKIEKNVLMKAREHDHPFIARLISTFHTETRLCFVLEYCLGGDLMHHIQAGPFDIPRSRFYAAEVCLVLKFLHENGIIYRDLKLENILLTSSGHIKVIDFITSAENIHNHQDTTKTFCGTPEFMAPEMLLDKPYGRTIDWWAFGILLYQMTTSQPPFHGEDEDEIYDSILADEPHFPPHLPTLAVDLVRKLFVRNPEERIGYHKGAEEIMAHEFFQEVDWEKLYRREVRPPFTPTVGNGDGRDLSNHGVEFLGVGACLTPVVFALSPAMQEEFRDFSFSGI